MTSKATYFGLDQGNFITIAIVIITAIGSLYVMKNDIEHLESAVELRKQDADMVHAILLDLIFKLRECD